MNRAITRKSKGTKLYAVRKGSSYVNIQTYKRARIKRKNKSGPIISLVEAYLEPDSVDILYRLLAERDSFANISHNKMPTMAQHRSFVESMPYRAWFLILSEHEYVGAIYVTANNDIGLQIFKKYWRRGYGTAAIKRLISTIHPLPGIPSIRPKEFCVSISPLNGMGHGFLIKAGFNIRQITYDIGRK